MNEIKNILFENGCTWTKNYINLFNIHRELVPLTECKIQWQFSDSSSKRVYLKKEQV